jgi:hypothetical protein
MLIAFAAGSTSGAPQSLQNAKPNPVKLDVISAIVASMNEADDKDLATVREDLATSTKNCHNHAEAGCTYNVALGNPTWCFPNLVCQKTRDACVEATEKYFCGNDDRTNMDFQTQYYPVLKAIIDDNDNMRDDRSKLAKDFKYRSSQYVMMVEKTNNYEGNIISYVNFRTKGTDNIDRYKVTIQLHNNSWVVVSTESAPQ